MSKILTTNFKSVQWTTQTSDYFPNWADRILSVPRIIQYSVIQKDDWNTPGETFEIVTRWETKWLASYNPNDFIPQLPSQYSKWSLSDTITAIDSPTWTLTIGAIYTYVTSPDWFQTYYENNDFANNYARTFTSLLSNLWYDSSNWYNPNAWISWWITNRNVVLAVVSMYDTSIWWSISNTFWVFVINDPTSWVVDDYFVTNMSGTCEFLYDSWSSLSGMFQNNNGFLRYYEGGISSGCWVSLDDIVAHLYANKIS